MRVRLTQCLEHAARYYGDKTAIVDGELRLNWAQFKARVQHRAAAMRQSGIGEGDRMAVLSHNSSGFLEVFYAALWAGAVIVPLNTRLAAPEIRFQLQDAEVALLFHSADFQDLVADVQVEGCRPVAIEDQPSAHGADIASSGRNGDDLAAIYFTGGTTGKPKGVMLSHESLHAMSRNFIMAFGIDSHCVNLHSAPMFHVSAVGIFFTTMVGGTHVFSASLDAGTIIRMVAQESVTHCFTVPAIIDRMTRHELATTSDLSSLRLLGYGGSAMPVAVMEAARARFPMASLAHGYGMTEVPALTCLGPEDHLPDADPARLRSVGRSMIEYEIRVVDPEGRICAPHEAGEIIARGPNMMLGYWNRPEETAEALRDGWMHTQDVGHVDEGGYLYISDRIKDMIVSGAENVYSIEVEDVLYRHPAVAECAIIGVPDAKWGERVHAVIVLDDGASATAQELIDFCKTQIAGYKCPKTVQFRTEPLPRSAAAGKVLKNVLREEARILASKA